MQWVYPECPVEDDCDTPTISAIISTLDASLQILVPRFNSGRGLQKTTPFSFVTDKSYLRQTKANSAPAKTKLAALRSAAWMPIRVT